MFGSDENKKIFYCRYEKNPLMCFNIEVNGYFGITRLKLPIFMKPLYDPEVIQIAPISLSQTKKHTWVSCQLQKRALRNVGICQNTWRQAIKISAEKINNVSITSVLPSWAKNSAILSIYCA